jgi:hypothetical protein
VTPTTEFLVGDADAQHVLIRPLSRREPGLFDNEDGNWIDCEVQIAVGGFRGTFRMDLSSEEFRDFSEELAGLSQTLEGTVTFSSEAGQVVLSLTAQHDRRVRISGEAIDAPESGNRLQFSFDIDQTSLPLICRSLDDLLAAFPVAAAPDIEQT